MHDSDYGSNDYDDGHDDGNDRDGLELLQSRLFGCWLILVLIAEELGRSVGQVRQTITRLEDLGLVSRPRG